MNRKQMITILATVMNLVIILVPIVANAYQIWGPFAPPYDEEEYVVVDGVLASDNYALYPYVESSVDVGFSKYGENIAYDETTGVGVGLQYPGFDQVGTYNQLDGTSVDPFANEEIMVKEWINGWFIDIKKPPWGTIGWREIWAFAMFSDGRMHGKDWIQMPTVTEFNTARPLWQEHAPYANPDAEAYVPGLGAAYWGGRKTNGICETAPLEILYDGPREFVAVSKTRIKDSDGTDLVDVFITIIFNKVKKSYILLKDVKIVWDKTSLNIQFGNRHEWDLSPPCYVHWYTDEPVQFWDLDGNGTIEPEERAESSVFFKEWMKKNKFPKKWWQDWNHTWPEDGVEESPEGPALPGVMPKDFNETQYTCYGIKHEEMGHWDAATERWIGAVLNTEHSWHVDPWIKKHGYAVAQVIDADAQYVAACAVWPHPEFWATEALYPYPYPGIGGMGDNLPIGLVPLSRLNEWHKWTVEADDLEQLPDRKNIWVKQDDMEYYAEPGIPFIIYEHDFELHKTAGPKQYRTVAVYIVTDYHDADDLDRQAPNPLPGVENRIDREIQYQLDEIFDPWDIYDVMHKMTKRWVQFYTCLLPDGCLWLELPETMEPEVGKPIPCLPVYPGFEDPLIPWDAYSVFSERVLVKEPGDVWRLWYRSPYHLLDPKPGVVPDWYTINFQTGVITMGRWLPQWTEVKVLWSSWHAETKAEIWQAEELCETKRFPLHHDVIKFMNETEYERWDFKAPEVFFVNQTCERIWPEQLKEIVDSPYYVFEDNTYPTPDKITVYEVPKCKEVSIKYNATDESGEGTYMGWVQEDFHKDYDFGTSQTFNLTYQCHHIEKVWMHSEKCLLHGDYVLCEPYDNTIIFQWPIPQCEYYWIEYNCSDTGERVNQTLHGDGQTTEFELDCMPKPCTLTVNKTRKWENFTKPEDVASTVTYIETTLNGKIINGPPYPTYTGWFTYRDPITYEWRQNRTTLVEIEYVNATNEMLFKGNWIIHDTPTCDELVLNQPINVTRYPNAELKIVYQVYGGRYEWTIVGRDSHPVDSIGSALVTAAIKNKNMEIGTAGMDMMYTEYDISSVPYVMRCFGTAPGTKTDYLNNGSEPGDRASLRDDWCETWPVASSNLITVGGPLANVLTGYLNDFTAGFYGTPAYTPYGPWSGGVVALTCWEKDPLARAYFSSADTGYAVIGTYKDLNGTVVLSIWGVWGRDTFYAAQWFDQHKFELQHINLHVTSIILEIDYTDPEHPSISIVEHLGTISEKPQHTDC